MAGTADKSDCPQRTNGPARFFLKEAAGSFGDIGTFLPMAVGLVQIVGMDAGSVLLWTGLMCIVTGLVFRVPMAVQPMKAVGALAIAGLLTAAQVGVAGLTVGLCMLVIGVTGLARRLYQVIPRPVLCGLQVAVALQLMYSGTLLALFTRSGASAHPALAPEGLFLSAGAVLVLLILRRRIELAALVIVAAGLAGAAINEPALIGSAQVSFWHPRWPEFGLSSLAGAWNGGLAQLPLTLLNSVFAVSALAVQLFPEKKEKNTPARLAISVGLMNLLVCPLGGMPLCHGSGGLAAQYRFGGRSGLTLVIRGLLLLVLGLFFGGMALAWMRAFPPAIVGIFLIIAGVGLASATQFWKTVPSVRTAAVVLLVHVATGMLVVGFAAGWVAHVLMSRRQWIERLMRLGQRTEGSQVR